MRTADGRDGPSAHLARREPLSLRHHAGKAILDLPRQEARPVQAPARERWLLWPSLRARSAWLVVGIGVVVAAALSLHGLASRPLSADEASSVRFATAPGLSS